MHVFASAIHTCRQQLRARNAPFGVEIEHCIVQLEFVSNDQGNNIIVKRLESYLITIRRYINPSIIIIIIIIIMM